MAAERAVVQLVVGLGALALGGSVGCSTEDDGGLATLPTRIAVAPAAFLGDLPCSAEPGAMRSYVVTLYAWSGPDDVTPFTVGASYPTSCARTIAFENVVTPGSYYTADVHGYEQVPESLEPFGGFSSGSTAMTDVVSGAIVAPRWRTRCGASAAEGTAAVANQVRFIAHCSPLADSSPTPTAIRFAPEALFGAEPCLVVSEWSIYPDDPALAPATELGCTSEPVDYVEAVQAGSFYSFYLAASLDDLPLGTECYADARDGVMVTPACGPLRADGYVDVRLTDLVVEGGEPLCPDGARFTLALDGAPLVEGPFGCGLSPRIGPLAPGDYQIDAVVVDGSGAPAGPTASCSATVEAGRAVDASCVP